VAEEIEKEMRDTSKESVGGKSNVGSENQTRIKKGGSK
jgi:hypothetical protein